MSYTYSSLFDKDVLKVKYVNKLSRLIESAIFTCKRYLPKVETKEHSLTNSSRHFLAVYELNIFPESLYIWSKWKKNKMMQMADLTSK